MEPEPERLEPTLSERLDEIVDLVGEDQGAEAESDEPTAAETRRRVLRERLGDYRKRLVVKEPQRHWWQPRNR